MRKIIAIILALTITMCSIPSAFASTATNTVYDDNDDAFVAAMYDIMKEYKSNPAAAEAALNEIDASVIEGPITAEHYTNSDARGTNPTDYTLSVYCLSRGNGLAYYLYFDLTANASEWLSGPLDYVSIEWDTAYADYYSSDSDGEFTTVQGLADGVVAFNVQDSDLKSGDTASGSVRLDPKKSGDMLFGAKYVHTYTSFLVSGSASYSFLPSYTAKLNGDMGLGLNYTYSLSVNVGTDTSKWQIWEDSHADIW